MSAISQSLRAQDAATYGVEAVLRKLGAKASKGLSNLEAEERRKVHGANEFLIKEDDPLWKKYLNQVSG